MGIQTFNFTGLVETFTPLAGITDYTFTVTGGGGSGSSAEGTGGNGAIVTATYSGLTPSNILTIIVGAGGTFQSTSGSGSGGGLSQVLLPGATPVVNIIAGGGGGSGGNSINGLDGGTPNNLTVPSIENGKNGFGTTGGAGGSNAGLTAGTGGSYPNNNGGDPDLGGGGGGGAAFNTGVASTGGVVLTSSYNGGGGESGGGGGGGGFSGGGGGGLNYSGGGGSSIANGSLLSSAVQYDLATIGSTPGGGGPLNNVGLPGRVVITWTDTPTPPTPTSNICFPAGTPIQTDQGIINIEQLDKNINTIRGEPILQITKTVTLDKYLIYFEKSSLGRNIPNKKTIMSKDHKIEFQGQMVPSYKMLDYSKEVKKVKYSGEVLYNVLLPKYSLMNVNGLMCETLHPENIIAKLYNGAFTEEERNNIIFLMNDALEKKDLVKYKTALNRIG
jgi:hypothetical protein